jgi:hypothetical protein
VSEAGTEIRGRYRLEELLGRGAMSEVWRARDLELDRTVAVKLLAPTAEVERFRREARAVAALAHENVVQVYDYGEDEGRPYMVLEHVPGGTLDERLQEAGPLDPAEATAVGTGIAAGLAHAHERGVVHRDLKPANVLFDAGGRPKLADFGIARMAAGEGTLTEAGTVLGTAAYISPEQAAGETATPASDVYSFGVILYRMLTGRLPFESDDPMALAQMHRTEPPPGPETLPKTTPPALAGVVAATLAKDPAARPSGGAQLLAALRGEAYGDPEATRVLSAAAVAAAAPADAAPAPASAPRRPARTAVVATVLVLLAACGAGLAWVVTGRSSGPSLVTEGSTTGHASGATLPRQSTRHATSTTVPIVQTTHKTTTASTTRPARTATTHQTTTAPPTTTSAGTTTATTTAPTTTAATTAATTTAAAATTTAGRTTAGGTSTTGTTTAGGG